MRRRPSRSSAGGRPDEEVLPAAPDSASGAAEDGPASGPRLVFDPRSQSTLCSESGPHRGQRQRGTSQDGGHHQGYLGSREQVRLPAQGPAIEPDRVLLGPQDGAPRGIGVFDICDFCDFVLTSSAEDTLGAEEDQEMTVEAAFRTDVIFPPEDLDSLGALVRFVETNVENARLVGPTGDEVLLPSEVYQVLVEVVEAMRAGKAVSLAPTTQRLTTQQAANFLGVSRPTLVKLLEEGRIRFDRPGRHRRVSLLDLLAYQLSRRSERREVLRSLTNKSSEMGLYEKSAQDYRAALEEARRRRPVRAPT